MKPITLTFNKPTVKTFIKFATSAKYRHAEFEYRIGKAELTEGSETIIYKVYILAKNPTEAFKIGCGWSIFLHMGVKQDKFETEEAKQKMIELL